MPVAGCHSLDPIFNLVLFGLVLTVVALLGVLLYLALIWPREQSGEVAGPGESEHA